MMKNESFGKLKTLFGIIALSIAFFGSLMISGCKKEETIDCITRTKQNQYFGYQVWAGDSALFGDFPYLDPTKFYNVDKYYTLIGSGTTTKTFNTGSYKYYVIVAPYYCCIDAVKFNDGSYYDFGTYTLIGGLAEHPAGGTPAGTASRFLGAPDGVAGNLGYKNLCHEPSSFGGFMTDDGTITSRGSGLTVYVVDNCY